MTIPYISKSNIIFLPANELIFLISSIEDQFPGWWWSISQSENLIRFSMGPARECPYLIDREFVKTPKGDNGFIFNYYFHHLNNLPDLIDYFQYNLNLANEYRTSLRKFFPNLDIEKQSSPYRFQSQIDLNILKFSYKNTLENFKAVELQGYEIKELYLGSCQLSVDCSIRGVDDHLQNFDISCDLTTGSLYDSLDLSTKDLTKQAVRN